MNFKPDPFPRRLLYKSFIVVIVVLLISNLVYSLFVHDFVTRIYEGEAGSFNRIIRGQDTHPIGLYIDITDRVINGLTMFGILFILGGLLLLFIFEKIQFPSMLLFLIWIDVCFLAAELFVGGIWSSEFERSFPEFYSYAKLLLVTWLFYRFYVLSRRKIYFMLFLMGLYYVIDDSVNIHYMAGPIFGRVVPNFIIDLVKDPTLRPHIGEFIYLSLLGGVFILGLLWFYMRSDSSTKGLMNQVFGFLGLLAFFVIVADLLHALFSSTGLVMVFGIFENSGEAIVMSLGVYLLWEKAHSLGYVKYFVK